MQDTYIEDFTAKNTLQEENYKLLIQVSKPVFEVLAKVTLKEQKHDKQITSVNELIEKMLTIICRSNGNEMII